MKASRYSVKSFKDLKEALECSDKQILTEKSIPDNKTDEEIFLDAMADVREIKEFREIPSKKPLRIKHLPSENDDSFKILREIVNGKRKIRLSDTGEYIEWVSQNIRKDIARRLHQGHFSVQDFIDLHGMTLGEAEEAFSKFFKDALRRRLFCIKVIHGRGLRSFRGPVLKEALKKWLHGTFRKWVLAYSSAKDCDGGLGATYIILKTSR
ncbi:MAG: Smr/MutS family protein [Nitrospirae bacterium]|nr:Smr/MutS family protein [Nitrospirota bacterium]